MTENSAVTPEPGVDASASAPGTGGTDDLSSALAAEEQAEHIDLDVAAAEVDSDVALIETQVVELTADLQRLSAEYANYRKRVERDREVVRDMAFVQVLGDLLPILDDIGRARAHDELNGGFKSVGEALEAAVTRLGLEKYAAVWDAFDPTIHEAIGQVDASVAGDVPAGVSGQVCAVVHQPGYRFKDRVVRPALVSVTDI